MIVQWNPSMAATLGEHYFGRYTGVAFIDRLFCTQTVHLGHEFLAVISQLAFVQGWPFHCTPIELSSYNYYTVFCHLRHNYAN